MFTKSLMRLLLLIGILSVSIYAESEPVEIVDIAKLDREMTLHRAKQREFRNKSEYRHRKKKLHTHHSKENTSLKRGKHYRDGHAVHTPTNRYRPHLSRYRNHIYAGKPHRHFKRGWVLAYKYDRADFYDRDGYHYGYFNRYGYMFEGEFYRYDRHYRYRDRVRGRGLFDRYYYRPADWRYYGFCR